jgi:hypothetical protein
MWQSGTSPPKQDIWVLGGGVTDEADGEPGPSTSPLTVPKGQGQPRGWHGSLCCWPQFPQWKTGPVESWNVRFWDSGEGLASALSRQSLSSRCGGGEPAGAGPFPQGTVEGGSTELVITGDQKHKSVGPWR